MGTAWEQLPQQRTGRQTDFTKERRFEYLAEAHSAFQAAAGRLLSVSNWHACAGEGSAMFTLCNNRSEEVGLMAEEGFFFNIVLPGPGPDAGDGLEWVIIEKLVSEGSAHTAEEYTLTTLRPVPEYRKDAAEIAHFYKDISTSTFIVRRDCLVLGAGAHGRNETPNNEEVDLFAKVGNTAIGLMHGWDCPARNGKSGSKD
jgi:hypothetical protein